MKYWLSEFVAYLRQMLFHWRGVAGELSLIAFFIPTLGNYRVFLAAVAVLAFIVAGFNIYQEQAKEHAGKLSDAKAAGERRVEELQEEIDRLNRPSFTTETRHIAEAAYRQLSREQKIALRRLLISGELTDRQALDHLHSRGMAHNFGSVLGIMSTDTTLVQPVSQHTGRDRMFPYAGPYRVNPMFRDVLTELVEADESTR